MDATYTESLALFANPIINSGIEKNILLNTDQQIKMIYQTL